MRLFLRLSLCLILLGMVVGAVTADDITPLPVPATSTHDKAELPPLATGSQTASWAGTVRVFMVEPNSRWNDHQGNPYQFGFLGMAMTEALDLTDATPWTQTVTWNAAYSGFSDITSNNIMAIAVLFNADGEERDAVPPLGYYYTMYPVDAATSATPGSPGSNEVPPGATHTVFIEEGSLTT
ncbi:MAG: hypothetical protein ABIE70_09640 [bacterium]